MCEKNLKMMMMVGLTCALIWLLSFSFDKIYYMFSFEISSWKNFCFFFSIFSMHTYFIPECIYLACEQYKFFKIVITWDKKVFLSAFQKKIRNKTKLLPLLSHSISVAASSPFILYKTSQCRSYNKQLILAI